MVSFFEGEAQTKETLENKVKVNIGTKDELDL